VDKIKVRFNLGRGPRYRKWQVSYPDRVEYLDPNEFQLRLIGCQLVSQPKTAQQINEGANKRVCAWVTCDSIEVYQNGTISIDSDEEVIYNPRNKPYWVYKGENSDKLTIKEIVSLGNKLFINVNNIK
jgi:hypothetical protein